MTTNRRVLSYTLTAGLCAGLIACSPPAKQSEPTPAAAAPAPAPAPAASLQRYDMTGKVVSVDTAGKKITVDHEAIPGFMGAMTMAYPVKDAHLLDGLAPGQAITAKVVSGGGDFWLEDVAATK